MQNSHIFSQLQNSNARNGGNWNISDTVHKKAIQYLKAKATKHLQSCLATDGWMFRDNQKWKKDSEFKILETPTSPCETIIVTLTGEAKTRNPRCEGRYHAVKGRRVRGRQVIFSLSRRQCCLRDLSLQFVLFFPGIPERKKRRQ